MNDLLQKHGCSNVFTIPEGLKELMSDISREVLRQQPKNIYDFISKYLSVLLITREHGVMAVRILKELCDCRPSVSEHLLNLGLDKDAASTLANVIKDEIESLEEKKDKERIKEADILKKILIQLPLDEEMAAKVCQVARNAYKDFLYKKKLMEQSTKLQAEEPWEVAAERTLTMYKKTKPSLEELNRATERIQKYIETFETQEEEETGTNSFGPGFWSRFLLPGKASALPGPPLDVAGSREIDLGPVIDIHVREVDVNTMFGEHATGKLGLHYDPTMTLTNLEDENILEHTDEPFLNHNTKNENAAKYYTNQTEHSTNPEVLSVHVESRKRGSRNALHPGIMRHGLFNHEAVEHNSDIDYRSAGIPARKISFSTVPPEFIPDDYLDDNQEVQEAIQEAFDEVGVDTCQDIPEEIPDGEIEDYSPVASAVSLISTDVEEQVEHDREVT